MPLLQRSGEAARLLLDLVTRDPPFVRGGALDPQDIPVFTFHSIEPRSFERKMKYMKDAGYRAITMAAYLDALNGRRAAPRKSVLITIDDGRASTWTAAHPILARLEMRATAFLVTSAIHDSAEVSKHLDDATDAEWAGLASRDASLERPFLTWGEVRAMRDVIDIESHTHLHALVPMGREGGGARSAAMASGYGAFDCPFVWIDGREVRGAEVPFGHPLPPSAPRLSGRPAYRSIDGRFETSEEMREAIRFDLHESMRLLRENANVDTAAVCYPWHVHSGIARSIAAEVGYAAGFAGKANTGASISRVGSDLFSLARVGEDYVERLPGPARRSLPSILAEKLVRKR